MKDLTQYVIAHTSRGECQCGRCADKGNAPDPVSPIPDHRFDHTADMIFFKVCIQNDPKKDELKKLISEHKGAFNEVDLFDGQEHNYMELGGWIGDQGLALQFMALTSLVGLTELMTPLTMLPGILPQDLVMQMAQTGYVAVRAQKEQV